ncbi:MAG: InlB B-repeat-containing protein [Lachnospiraceae bacterium]|nr:InlB B-repeat-containing protein [Lachnospiraceae bacterium]
MGKRILALFLAVLLIFDLGTETVFAMGSTVQQQEEGTSDAGEEERQIENTDKDTELNSAEGEEVCHTITFDFAGGQTSDGKTSEAQQVADGEFPDTSRIAEPVKTGYLLQGWVDAEGEAYAFNQPVKEDITLKALWSPITYRIQFNSNGGTGTMPEMSLKYDAQGKTPANGFYRRGYAFNGWILPDGRVLTEEAAIKNLSSQDGAVVVLKAAWAKGKYAVRFHGNGGTGSMKDQVFTWGTAKKLSGNEFKRTGYTFIGWNTRKDGKGTVYQNKQKVDELSEQSGGIVVLFAMWRGNSYQVKYNGNGAGSGTMKNSSYVYGTTGKLAANKFKRTGYTFAGWNSKKDGKGKNYSNLAQIKNLTTKKNGVITLYAKWKAIKYKITYKTKGGKMLKGARKSYTISTKTFTLPRPVRKGYDFDGWYRDAKYKRRVGGIKKGSKGNLTLYAKWTKCTRKGNKSSAKITKCKAVGKNKVQIVANIKKRIASSDDYYYLVYIQPGSGKAYKEAARTYKRNKVTFNLKSSENQGYVVSQFGIAIKRNGKYQLISNTSFVKSPEKAAKNRMKYQPGKTKKGIQYSTSMSEVRSCKAKQTFLNITASSVLNNGYVPYQYNGKTYYFSDMARYKEIVSECNRRGITVTVQILLDWTEGHTDLIASKARVRGASPYYSWNISSAKSREKMEAMFCYLGKVFGQKNCCVMNWVLGNEVNNPYGWNYQGRMSEGDYFYTYTHAFRSLYCAVKSQYANANVFICTDNLWNTSPWGGYSAKYVIYTFATMMKQIQPEVKWNLAYHAYSFPLTNTKVWKGYGITYDDNTPYITMQNLDVLTRHIKKHYGSSVRVILSEQGYSSTGGEKEQAAALAYSYYIAACNPMVDAFIIRSYDDHPVEVAQGLRMGISGKEAFKVYKNMDAGNSERYTKKYLKVIGAKSWKQIVPRYSKSRLKKMYRKR